MWFGTERRHGHLGSHAPSLGPMMQPARPTSEGRAEFAVGLAVCSELSFSWFMTGAGTAPLFPLPIMSANKAG